MPVEFSRTTAKKLIILPSDHIVPVPVITKISFIDPRDRYQETEHTIDNSGRSDRFVHVDNVVSSAGATGTLAVERIDLWKSLDKIDRAQETQLRLDNVTGAETIPPHFSTHLRTHVVRYRSLTDPDVYIDSELIDQFSIIDPIDRYQETIFTLNNPQTSDDAQADAGDPDITDSGNNIDPPWRTDPFQNIIDWNDGTPTIPIHYTYFEHTHSVDIPPSDGFAGAWGRMSDQSGNYTGYPFNSATSTYTFAGDLDFRFVEQYFSPHTYDDTGGGPGTGDIKGYTDNEWDVGWTPGGFDSWYEQLQAYSDAGGFPAQINAPNMLDFIPYGFFGFLKPFYTNFYNAVHTGDPPWPHYYVRVRMTALGPITTDHPFGRY